MTKYTTENYIEHLGEREYDFFVLGGDIGGTNTKFGLSGVKSHNIDLISSCHFKTSDFTNVSEPLTLAINYFKKKYNINDIKNIAVAGAGPIINHECKLTNANFIIKKDEVEKIARCKGFVINDFEAMGFGINILQNEDLIQISNLQNNEIKNIDAKGILGIIGAGTGLGESILVFDYEFRFYRPLPSEGGHINFPAENEFESEMANFINIKEKSEVSGDLPYEDFLSSRGIENIYSFIRYKNFYPSTSNKYTKKIDLSNQKTPLIATEYSEIDKTCKKTMEIFIKFYARFAINFALTILPKKLYITGGIAQKNIKWFRKNLFISEFEKHRKYDEFLKEIPVYIITNPNIGLYGACFAAANIDKLSERR